IVKRITDFANDLDVHQNGWSFLFDIRVNKTQDSLEALGVFDNNQFGIDFKLVSVDTGFTGVNFINVNKDTIHITPFVYLSTGGLEKSNAILMDGNIFTGSNFHNSTSSGKRTALIAKYSPEKGEYVKHLLFPENSKTHDFKYNTILKNLDEKDGKIFSSFFDADDYSQIFGNQVPNQIYVGKTDTSLDGWEWYRYLEIPGKYLVSYFMLATQD